MKKLMKISLNMFIISIILIFQIIFSFLFALRYFFSEDNVYNLISNINTEQIINNPNTELNKLYEVTSAVKISKEDTIKIMESDSIKKYFSKYIISSIESLKDKNGVSKIKLSDIEKVLLSSKKENINISDESMTLIKENKDMLQKYLDIVPNKINDNISYKTNEIIAFVLSGNLFIIYFIILIFSYLILSLANLSFKKAFINFGIILSVETLLLIILFNTIFKSMYFIYYGQKVFIKNIIAFNSLGLFIGMLSINISFIIRRIYEKR